MENVSTEQFIESVRSNRALWDSTCSTYKNNLARQAGWKNVLSDLDISVNEKNVSAASKKFAALKYKFNAFQNMGRSGAAGTSKEFIWARRLDFLKDSMAPRRSKPLWSKEEMCKDSVKELNTNEETQLEIEYLDEETDMVENCTQNDLEISSNGFEKDSENANSSGRKRKNCFLQEKIKLKRQDLELKERFLKSKIDNEADPKKHFCDMLYAEIKDLDMTQFKILRRRVLEVVDDIN